MKRAAVCIVIGVLAWGMPARACPPDRATGARGDRLVVGFAPAAPFIVTRSTDDEVHGIAIDLLRTLAARERWRLDLVELGAETLRTRLERCELDLGVVGVPINADLAGTLDLSLPYLSTVTTVIVRDDDPRAEAAEGHGRVSRIVC